MLQVFLCWSTMAVRWVDVKIFWLDSNHVSLVSIWSFRCNHCTVACVCPRDIVDTFTRGKKKNVNITYKKSVFWPEIKIRSVVCTKIKQSGFRLGWENSKPWVSYGRAMAQAVSRRPLTAQARVSPFGICGAQSGIGTGFFPEYFCFPLSVSFHRRSLTWRNEKNESSSSQGCTISLKAAVRP
jgi:hypothetical protein